MREFKFKVGDRVIITSGFRRGSYVIIYDTFSNLFNGPTYIVRLNHYHFVIGEDQLGYPISSYILRDSNART